MTAIMWQAANMEDHTDSAHEVIAQLQRENHMMRELLQLELLDSTSTDGQIGAETLKPPSSDAAIQTHSSVDNDPFCTGDFATVRPRPSSRTLPSTERRTADNDSRHSPCPQHADSEDGCPKFPSLCVSPENPTAASSNKLELSNEDGCQKFPSSCVSPENPAGTSDKLESSNEDRRQKFPTSSISPENPAAACSDKLQLSNDVSSSPAVDYTPSADEVQNINSSDSLETLVSPDELLTNDEYL